MIFKSVQSTADSQRGAWRGDKGCQSAIKRKICTGVCGCVVSAFIAQYLLPTSPPAVNKAFAHLLNALMAFRCFANILRCNCVFVYRRNHGICMYRTVLEH